MTQEQLKIKIDTLGYKGLREAYDRQIEDTVYSTNGV